jgi:hypothetical protein
MPSTSSWRIRHAQGCPRQRRHADRPQRARCLRARRLRLQHLSRRPDRAARRGDRAGRRLRRRLRDQGPAAGHAVRAALHERRARRARAGSRRAARARAPRERALAGAARRIADGRLARRHARAGGGAGRASARSRSRCRSRTSWTSIAATRSISATASRACCPPGTPKDSPATPTCSACTPSASRSATSIPRPSARAAGRSSSPATTAGRCTRWRT